MSPRFVWSAILTLVLIMMIVPWVLSGFGGVAPYVVLVVAAAALLWLIFGPEKKHHNGASSG